MIQDELKNLGLYLPISIRNEVISFLPKLTIDIPEGEYPIIEDKVFARVMSYPLKPADICKVEAHDKYVDIQSVLSGSEGIDIFNRSELVTETMYDTQKDMIYFSPGKIIQSIIVEEGRFALLLPHEAHRPQVQTYNCTFVKKFVIKAAAMYWEN